MDLSHARKYSVHEIENLASKTLISFHPNGVHIPIDIDLIVQHHPLVDHIVPIELLQDKFNVVAVLYKKPNGKFDILVDEETYTLTYKAGRANFSIAHEFGHILLHEHIWDDCYAFEDILKINGKIKSRYTQIEKDADYFAGAFLIPYKNIHAHVGDLYEGLVKLYGYNLDLIPNKLGFNLANQYKVSFPTMEIRLKQIGLLRKVHTALRHNVSFLQD